MKNFMCVGFIGFMLSMGSAMAKEKEVTVSIEGIEVERGGNILLLVFSQVGFPKQHEQALQLITVKADTENKLLSFITEREELALKVLHDEDENGKVTKNWTGILPAEGLGFSNNQKITLTGPPGYKKAKVSISDNSSVFSIQLRYP